MSEINFNGLEVAIIGMSCRFPDSDKPEKFWENLMHGKEAITYFSDDELRQMGVSEEQICNKNYIKSGFLLKDFDSFDERFFGYNPKEALVMDPQVRVFHECAWEAFENSGYNPDTYSGKVGVFTGASSNYNWNAKVFLNDSEYRDLFTELQLSNKDFLASRLSYKFNLTGPSFTVNSACSTSLSAIHTACNSLISGECDMALAGGVSILIPQVTGYEYKENFVFSKDGHIRAFDKEGSGIVFGSGAGAFILKPLENAIKDGDNILAVIKGSAVGNDGNRKASFAAPSVDGQSEVIMEAMQIADVQSDMISYVETHGTGTSLGDAIEISALKKAFEDSNHKCYLGAVKNNIGHLDAASGIASCIKVILAMQHHCIPPTINYITPNPNLELENSNFEINTEPIEWRENIGPLRAGVSSFGMGGTNAHIILEEAPRIEEEPKMEEQQKNSKNSLILLSAQTEKALAKMSDNLVNFLKEHDNVNLNDLSYTLQVGRKGFDYRKRYVCKSVDQLIEKLSDSNVKKNKIVVNDNKQKDVIFMFSGQGSQYINMGDELYKNELVFRESMDAGIRIIKEYSNIDLRDVLYPDESHRDWASKAILNPEYSMLALFIFEYSLAKLLLDWGIKPKAVIGYSFGEYIAAAVSGLISLEQSIALILKRSELFQKLPDGVMLSIPLPVEDVLPFLEDDMQLSIDNGNSCVIGGPVEKMTALEKSLTSKKVFCTRLLISKVIHTSWVEPILEEYEKYLNQIEFHTLQIPYISDVTGKIASTEEISDPQYWLNHLSKPVKFVKCLDQISRENTIFLEIGPGNDLTLLTRRVFKTDSNNKAFDLIPINKGRIPVGEYFYGKIGELWQNNVTVNWQRFNQKGKRIPLPTYPFEHHHFDLDNIAITQYKNTELRRNLLNDWFYTNSWKRMNCLNSELKDEVNKKEILVFCDSLIMESCHEYISNDKVNHYTTVKIGDGFKEENETCYVINPRKQSDYETLFSIMKKKNCIPNEIIHMWTITNSQLNQEYEVDYRKCLELGYHSIIKIVQEFEQQFRENCVHINIVTNELFEVIGGDLQHPEKSILLGLVNVVPKEYQNIRCKIMDIGAIPDKKNFEKAFFMKIKQFDALDSSYIALRNQYFWKPDYEKLILNDSYNEVHLKDQGVYIVFGGFGGIGNSIIKELAKETHGSIIIAGRTRIPERQEWETWFQTHAPEDDICIKIKQIKELEKYGARVHPYTVDICDKVQVAKFFNDVYINWHEVNGVIHCAGVSDGELIQMTSIETTEYMLGAKVDGTYNLYSALKDKRIDFMMLFSSLSSIIPTFGQVGYSAANAFMDAFSVYVKSINADFPIMSIDWERWDNIGMSVEIQKIHKQLTGQELDSKITEEEGLKVFHKLLNISMCPHVIVSAYDINEMILLSKAVSIDGLIEQNTQNVDDRKLVELPQNETEKLIVDIWEKKLGKQGIETDDNLFDLGGDSVIAIGIIGEIINKLNVKIPMTYLFQNPTPKALSEYIIHSNRKTETIKKWEGKQGQYCLSSVQKRVFFLQKMNPTTTVYNNVNAYQLNFDLSVEKLREILAQIVQRHEILRTSFQYVDNQVLQIVNSDVSIDIEIYNEKDSLDEHEVMNGFVRPFSLDKKSLLRIGYVEGKNILLIDMHHLISDELSHQLLINEIIKLSKKEELTDLQLQYGDYAQWQESLKGTEQYENQKKYWLTEFLNDDRGRELRLPFDYKRQKLQDFKGAALYCSIDQDKTYRFRQLIQAHDMTLYMGLLGVYGIMLSKVCQDDCIIVGTPVSSRRQVELEKVIGSFVDTIALKLNINSRFSFMEYLESVKNKVIGAFDNQDYPFEELIKSLSLEPDLSRNPLFEVMFSLREIQSSAGQLVEIADMVKTFEHRTAMFPLRLTAWEYEGTIQLEFEYSTSLFRESTIRRFADYFINIVEAITSNPMVKLYEIDYISKEEKQKILYENNQTYCEIEDEGIIRLFERQVELHSNKIAVVDQFRSFTYSELNHKVNQLAHYLQCAGVSKETPVGVYLERSNSVAISILAVLKAGGCYVPIDIHVPYQRFLQILEQAHISIVISTSNIMGDVSLDNCKVLLVDCMENELSQQSTSNLNVEIDENQIAYMIFTSGSTGKPKGVIIQHKPLLNLICSVQKILGITEKDRLLSVTTISFDVFNSELFPMILAGAQIVFASKDDVKDGKKLMNMIEAYDISIVQATPATWKILIFSGWKGKESLKIISTGEAMQQELAEVLITLGESLWNFYGPTETTVYASAAHITDPTSLTIGKPIDNMKMYVLDEYQNVVPVGVYGELYIGGIGLAKGYLNDTKLTDEKFIKNEFFDGNIERIYRTGDIARVLDDGTIEVAGRSDNQVKIRGFRIELSEIETVIAKYSGVKENIVVSETNILNSGHIRLHEEKNLVCYIVKESSATIDLQKFKDYLARILPPYMVPYKVYMIDSLPLNSNGKVDRKRLPLVKGTLLETKRSLRIAEKELEKKVIKIMEEILGHDGIAIDDSFFDIGGTSLLVALLQEKIKSDLNVLISIADIFSYPTAEKLVSLIEQRNSQDGWKGLVLPQEYFIKAQDSIQKARLQMNLVGKQKDIINNLSMKTGLKEEEVILALFFFILHQLTKENEIKIASISDSTQFEFVSMDFKQIKNFNSLFQVLKEIIESKEKDVKSIHSISVGSEYREKMFFAYSAANLNIADYRGKVNVLVCSAIKNSDIIIELQYDSFIFSGKQISKILYAFVQLVLKIGE